jgi:iron complex outermembrane receptor protein
MRTTELRRVLCASLSLAAVAMASPAVAQDLDPAEAAENEASEGNTILVTGLRRTDELQDTPASITAFTAETIEDAGITRPADFVNLTPNVTLVETQNAHYGSLIRKRYGEPFFTHETMEVDDVLKLGVRSI